jgi:hypothetical protein
MSTTEPTAAVEETTTPKLQDTSENSIFFADVQAF